MRGDYLWLAIYEGNIFILDITHNRSFTIHSLAICVSKKNIDEILFI